MDRHVKHSAFQLVLPGLSIFPSSVCVYKGCEDACRLVLKGWLSLLLTTFCVMQAGRRSRHRRISSWDANLEGRRGVDPALISPASSGELTATRPKVHCTVEKTRKTTPFGVN